MSVVSFQGRGSSKPASQSKAAVVAALDIGSTKISCMIADRVAAKHKLADARTSLRIIGFGHVASRGIKNGAVVNVEEAELAIRQAVDTAERMAQRRISRVSVSISGGRPQSLRHGAAVNVANGIVARADLDRAVAAALAEFSPSGRTLLHLAPIGFALDGIESEHEPIGLHGSQLAVEFGVVTVDTAAINNLRSAIEGAHLQVTGFSLAPLSAARAVLTDDEMTLGTAVVDIGGAVTTLAFVKNGSVIAADTMHIGGTALTHDIAQGLGTTIAHAERMKTLFGSALPNGHDANQPLAVPILGEKGSDSVHHVPKSSLNAIIIPRLEEILEQVAHVFSNWDVQVMRVVFTGGAAQLAGLRDLGQHVLQRPCRVGTVSELQGLTDTIRQPGFAVTAGLICQVLKPEAHYPMPAEASDEIEKRQMTYASRLTKWFREAI